MEDRWSLKVIVLVIALAFVAMGAAVIPDRFHPPVADDIWVRPSAKSPAEPTIGFKDGIRIGLWPAPNGPRGIIRVYAPYVFPKDSLSRINFIAVEPVVNGHRSFSELEKSKLDGIGGKRLWFAEDINETANPAMPWHCPRGKTGAIKSGDKQIKTLSIAIRVEKFENGAEPVILATFREDRPHEVSFTCYSAKTGAAMESCVLTATMGNFARARRLWLGDEVIDSRKLWTEDIGHGFFPAKDYPMNRLRTDADGTLTVAITPNETDPASVAVARKWWICRASVATQYWRKYSGSISEPLLVRVNGRALYYGTNTKIPGGVSYENFELIEKFTPGVESSFGVTPLTPEQMGWKIKKSD